jgi:hypothetical protein
MAYELSDYQSISKAMEFINKETSTTNATKKDKLSCSYAFIQYFFCLILDRL